MLFSTLQVLEQADILDVVHAQAVNTTENTKVLLCQQYFLQKTILIIVHISRREMKKLGKQFKTWPATGFTFSSSCSSSPSGNYPALDGDLNLNYLAMYYLLHQPSVPGLVQ